MPALFDQMRTFIELFFHGTVRDINGRPTYIPEGDRAFDGISALLGSTTIRSKDMSMLASMYTEANKELADSRRFYIEQIAALLERGDPESVGRAWDLILTAQEKGIDVPSSSIRRELELRQRSRLNSILRSVSVPVRSEQP